MRGLLLIVVVVLAGCNGLVGESTTTPGLTPVGDIRTEVGYPPGVDESGVVSPEALANTHSDLVSDRSYVLVSNRTVRYENGTLRSRLRVRIDLAENKTFYVRTSTAGHAGPVFLGHPPATGEYWSDGEVYVRYLQRDNESVYNTFQPPDQFTATWEFWTRTVAFGGRSGSSEETIQTVFGAVPTRITGVETRNGTTVYLLSGTGATSLAFAPPEVESAENVRLEAAVGADGLVREIRLQYDAVVAGDQVTVERAVIYRDVGSTTVSRPPWFDRAMEN